MADAPYTGESHKEKLDALERLGRIVNQVGVPLLLVFFIAVNIGWIPSPLSQSIRENTQLNNLILDRLAEHDRRTMAMEAERLEGFKTAVEAIKRLTDVLKMVDCSAIADSRLRERCLGR
jgi:hypothetical protein